jgi:hypothetical protein
MSNITVQEFVAEAVKEGIALAPMVYMEGLEQSLRSDVILTEAGSAQNYLQMMINEAIENAETETEVEA